MPHQTRSRGTPSSKEEEQQQLQGGDEPSSAPNATSHADDEGGSSRSSGARLPLEQGTQPQDYHPSSSSSSAATPARQREGGPSASSSSASRSRASARSPWGGGGGERRDQHGAARGSSAAGAMFSPPHYKTHPYPHSSDRHPHAPPPASTPGAASTTPNMDHHLHHSHVGAGRDFDQLDLNVDFTGPEDPLMLGSFGEEESPPRLPPGGRSPSVERERERDSERKRSSSSAISRLRRTPPPPPSQPTNPYAYQQSYRRSPRDTYDRSSGSSQHGGPPPPPPPHGYPYSGYAPLPPHSAPAPGYGGAASRLSPKHYPGYPPYPYHPEHYWDAPSGGHPYPAMYDHDDDIPPPPPSSTKKRPPSSTAAAAASVPLTASPEGTPEKPINTRSPFRSPPTSRKFKRSPDFHSSPHFGTYGSFGLDTPNAMLGPAEFSPMGPSLQEFDENAPLPLGISRSNSQDSATPVIRRPKEESSPLTGFMNVLSPFESLHGGIARSPVVNPPLHGYDDPLSSSRHLGRGPKPVTASGARGSGGEPRMHSTPHGSVKKALWPRSEGPPPSTPGRLRVEIGSTGALSTRKSLEGINSMMHSRHSSGRESSSSTTTPSRHESRYASSSHHHYRGPPVSHPGGYHGDLTTPIKSSYHSLHHTPSSMHRPYPASSASKYGHHGPPLLSHHKDYPGSGSKARYGPPSSSIPSSAGKENNKKQPPQAVTPKRSPCNCKKSKCLKLYCECFAAELFCQDCNCSDCGNTPTAGAIRDKAIKDTRAKNPNAFKPRFSAKNAPRAAAASPAAGHNMGCRCKKSECLKKYCECFQAGAICGAKCKCVDCLNFAGSQALIDKRRKIKDQRGADFAMRVADEAWRQGQPGGPPRRPAAPAAAAEGPPPPSSASRHPPSKSSIATPRGHMPPPPHMMHPSPRGGPPPPYEGAHGHPHHYHAYHSMPPQYMRGPPPPHGYAPMGMPMTPAGYPHHNYAESPHGMYPPHLGPPPPSSTQRKDLKRPPPSSAPPPTHVTPMAATPRTPGVRVQFDPASSRKKRKISIGQEEATIPFFGMKFPAQPKTTALAVFAFLSNDDLYNAGLVCKSWSQLAMDGELWKFET